MNQISKSECRNPNKLERQINLELGKSKTPNLKYVLNLVFSGHLNLFLILDPSTWLRTGFVVRVFGSHSLRELFRAVA